MQLHPSPPSGQAPPSPPSGLDATVEALRTLPFQQRVALSGMLAVLLGERTYWDAEPYTEGGRFTAWLLQHVMVSMLQLPAEQCTALLPLTEPQAFASGTGPGEQQPRPDPEVFAELLPQAPSERRASAATQRYQRHHPR